MLCEIGVQVPGTKLAAPCSDAFELDHKCLRNPTDHPGSPQRNCNIMLGRRCSSRRDIDGAYLFAPPSKSFDDGALELDGEWLLRTRLWAGNWVAGAIWPHSEACRRRVSKTDGENRRYGVREAKLQECVSFHNVVAEMSSRSVADRHSTRTQADIKGYQSDESD